MYIERNERYEKKNSIFEHAEVEKKQKMVFDATNLYISIASNENWSGSARYLIRNEFINIEHRTMSVDKTISNSKLRIEMLQYQKVNERFEDLNHSYFMWLKAEKSNYNVHLKLELQVRKAQQLIQQPNDSSWKQTKTIKI